MKGLGRLLTDGVTAAAVKAAPEGSKLYLVGGVLRNIALGAPFAPDYDFSFDGDTRSLAADVAALLGGSFFPLDEENGVWRVVSKGKLEATVDITPTIGGEIAADLAKRDFTINAIALQLLPEPVEPLVADPFGGLDDAGSRLIRAVSDAVFDDDPLRLLRAVRLSAEYGLVIEKGTWDALVSKAPLISNVSPERARDELVRLMNCTGASSGIRLLRSSGLMQELIPETKGWEDIGGYDLMGHSMSVLDEAGSLLRNISEETFPGLSARLVELFARPTPVSNVVLFRLAALLHDFGKAQTLTREDGRLRFTGHDAAGARRVVEVMERLRFSRRNSSLLAALVKNHHRVFMLASLKERTFRAKSHFFRATGGEPGVMLLCLALADARATRGGEDPDLLEAVLETLRFYYEVFLVKKPAPLLTGRDVMESFGLSEGPLVGEVLRKVGEGVETGAVRNRKEALEYAGKWLRR